MRASVRENSRLRNLLREIGRSLPGSFITTGPGGWTSPVLFVLHFRPDRTALTQPTTRALESIGPGHDPTATALGIRGLVITATAPARRVFLAGAVELSLDPCGRRPAAVASLHRPPPRYGRLIAVDILFVLAVALGLNLSGGSRHGRLRLPRAGRAGGRNRGPAVASRARSDTKTSSSSADASGCLPDPSFRSGGRRRRRAGSAAICETLFATPFLPSIAEALADIAISPLFAIASGSPGQKS